jgi:THAP domain
MIFKMGATCYVVGCKSGYKSNKETGIHFFRPRDNKTLVDWRQAIPRNRFILNSTHRVCHKHFDEEDVIKQLTFKGKDGIIVFPLLHWRLKPEATPKHLLGNFCLLANVLQ